MKDWFTRQDWRVLPPLLVTVGAVAATAHGGFMVALAASVPVVIAALYPLITDGLALVAYIAARAGLGKVATAYAWLVTIVAAGLSGLAQAVYLQSQGHPDITGWLGFGIGYWPAVAGLLAAHLVYVQRVHRPAGEPLSEPQPTPQVSPLAMGLPHRAANPSALLAAAMSGAEIVRVPTDADAGELRPFEPDQPTVEPVIRGDRLVSLDKPASHRRARRGDLPDTERQHLLRIARDTDQPAETRMAAAKRLHLSQRQVGELFGVPQHVGRRLLAKPDQASTVLANSRFADQAKEGASR